MAELGVMCLMALETLPPIDLYTVRRAAATIAPDASLSIERRAIFPDEPAMMVTFDDQPLAIHAVRERIPPDVYDEAVTGNLFWPAAADVMARHQARVTICAARAPRSVEEARDQAVAVSRLAVAFSQALPVLGLYWHGTGRMTAPDRLSTTPREIELGFWPVDIWLGYVTFGTDRPGEPLVVGARTNGATLFLGRELELPPEHVAEKIEPIRTLFDAARVLIGRGGPLADAQVVETPGKRGRSWQVEFAGSRQAPLARLIDLTEADRSSG